MSLKKYDEIESIDFGVLAPEEIMKLAVAKITVPITHSGSLPAPHGVNDSRLGAVDRRLKCATCQRGCSDCYGHMGLIALSFPVYNVGFIDMVLKILKSVCYFCSALILTESQLLQLKQLSSKDKKKRLAFAASLCKTKRACLTCAGYNPLYTKQGLVLKADFSKVQFTDPLEAAYCGRPFTSSEARTILQNISDEDCAVLGLKPSSTKPCNLIMTVFPVVPPIIRPSVTITDLSKSRGHDDLTSKLCDIVKANKNVAAILEKEAHSIPEVGLSIAAQTALNELTFHVGTFMNNDIRGQKPSYQRTGQPSRSIMSRLKGKEGRIRGTLMGKRVDFSARSVISPDPTIDMDEIGVPFKVAQTLTIPERVIDLNLSVMKERIRNGADYKKGLYSVVRNGTITLMEFADLEKEVNLLKPGDTVERYLRNGDMVLFNRQPSLHKGSMMGFHVRLMESKTFRLNLACAPSFNADCDGDECNLHALQDVQSQTEARVIMAAPLQIVSPQSNKPCMGLVQDSLLGAYLMSHINTRFSRMQICELMALLKYQRKPLADPYEWVEGAPYWTGQQAFELTFPDDFYYCNYKADPHILIEHGVFKQGRMCKLSLGTTYGSVVHRLWLDYSPEVSARFLSDVQRIVMRFLMWNGFSVRFSDCLTGKDVQNQVKNIIQFAEDKVKRLMDNEALVRALPKEAESACNVIANQVLTNIGKVVHASMDVENNALYQTVSCGSKGNLINVAQIMGCVGQQALEGRRIPSLVDGIQRIPISNEDPSLLRRYGFISRSYVIGLRPDEFFFYNISGREGLIDTSVKTATTGYMQRRLMKALETIKIEYDRTVRNSRNDLVQFAHGADDFDAAFLVRIQIDFILKPTSTLSRSLEEEEKVLFFPLLRTVRKARLGLGLEIDTTAFAPLRTDLVFAAVNLHKKAWEEQLHTSEWRDRLCDTLCRLKFGSRDIQELYLRWIFRHEVVKHFTDVQLAFIARTLLVQMHQAIIPPNYSLSNSSHSLSHCLTQSVLNTFHFSGVASKNPTLLGVPRIKELIDVAKNIRTPTMRVFPIADLRNATALKLLQHCLVHFPLGKAVSNSELVYVESFAITNESHFNSDEILAWNLDSLMNTVPKQIYNPYVCVLKIIKAPLLDRLMTPADVAEIVQSHLTPNIHVVYAQPNMKNWFLHLRLLNSGIKSTAYSDRPEEELVHLKQVMIDVRDRVCKDCFLSGIAGIKSASSGVVNISRLNKETDDIETLPETYIELQGSNLSGALGSSELDHRMAYSNDIMDVYNVLGIEAAARVLFEELQTTMGFDGNFINPRHISLLVSVMTFNKYFTPVSRHGLNRIAGASVIARCSFEETCDILIDAALFGESDPLQGISESVAIGAQAKIGTGGCHVISTLPCDKDEEATEQDDDIVFTSVDTDLEAQTSYLESASIELPYIESGGAPRTIGSMSLMPSEHNSYVTSSHEDKGSETYRPSSPRGRNVETKKRRYAPSSPRTQRAVRFCRSD